MPSAKSEEKPLPDLPLGLVSGGASGLPCGFGAGCAPVSAAVAVAAVGSVVAAAVGVGGVGGGNAGVATGAGVDPELVAITTPTTAATKSSPPITSGSLLFGFGKSRSVVVGETANGPGGITPMGDGVGGGAPGPHGIAACWGAGGA